MTLKKNDKKIIMKLLSIIAPELWDVTQWSEHCLELILELLHLNFFKYKWFLFIELLFNNKKKKIFITIVSVSLIYIPAGQPWLLAHCSTSKWPL